jgi:hypothetical protein
LLSKIQYNNYETGEFTEEKDRTLQETITLINTFPWQQQREHYAVGLTGPSITLQGPNNDFLKLAAYYHGKFVLYYCKRPKTLYSKSFDQCSDALPFLQSYFNDTEFDTAAFHQQNTWFQRPESHFITRSFIYDLNAARLLSACAPSLFLLTYASILSFAVLFGNPSVHALLLVAIPFWLGFFYFLRLLFNHASACRGQVLIVSKGRDEFAYGPADAPHWMNKKDIVELITHGRRAKGGYFAMTRVEIILQHDPSVDISCLLLNWDDLMRKFPGIPQSVIGESFPLMPPVASAPS